MNGKRAAAGLAITGLALHITLTALQSPPRALAQVLPAPPSGKVMQAACLGEPETLAKILMLWLQAFDYQSGVSLALRDLDRERVETWLTRILELDPRGQYPLMAAIRLYGDIPAEANQRAFAAFVHRQFQADPDRRWPWLAHAVVVARHRLRDLPLALRYARALADGVTPGRVPSWAWQLEWSILEEMGDIDGARAALDALLVGGRVTDPAERRFLAERGRALAPRAAP
ncbi:MAG: hypothetical protein HQM03_05215 [Magnetococcales bacterium]|nr:hypothetical protein [Magnetococcales bacterium]